VIERSQTVTWPEPSPADIARESAVDLQTARDDADRNLRATLEALSEGSLREAFNGVVDERLAAALNAISEVRRLASLANRRSHDDDPR
jgi:hypothetical protein